VVSSCIINIKIKKKLHCQPKEFVYVFFYDFQNKELLFAFTELTDLFS